MPIRRKKKTVHEKISCDSLLWRRMAESVGFEPTIERSPYT